MESSSDSGLTVIYDEESGVITFDWDESTHPEYNYLADLTAENFADLFLSCIKNFDEQQADASDSTLPTGGSGS